MRLQQAYVRSSSSSSTCSIRVQPRLRQADKQVARGPPKGEHCVAFPVDWVTVPPSRRRPHPCIMGGACQQAAVSYCRQHIHTLYFRVYKAAIGCPLPGESYLVDSLASHLRGAHALRPSLVSLQQD